MGWTVIEQGRSFHHQADMNIMMGRTRSQELGILLYLLAAYIWVDNVLFALATLTATCCGRFSMRSKPDGACRG